MDNIEVMSIDEAYDDLVKGRGPDKQKRKRRGTGKAYERKTGRQAHSARGFLLQMADKYGFDKRALDPAGDVSQLTHKMSKEEKQHLSDLGYSGY